MDEAVDSGDSVLMRKRSSGRYRVFIYRVFIKFCVFSKILKNILWFHHQYLCWHFTAFPRTPNLTLGPLDGRSIADRTAIVQKNHNFYMKKHFRLLIHVFLLKSAHSSVFCPNFLKGEFTNFWSGSPTWWVLKTRSKIHQWRCARFCTYFLVVWRTLFAWKNFCYI